MPLTQPNSLELGIIVRFDKPVVESFRFMKDCGISGCQFAGIPESYLDAPDGADTRALRRLMEQYDIHSCSCFCSFSGQDWNRWEKTVGLTPRQSRAERLAHSCRTARWAKTMGIGQIAIHVGLLPERSSHDYNSFVSSMREFLRYISVNKQVLAYETGQESKEELLALIDDIGETNQKINFDPANLLLYNSTDPREFLQAFSDKIVHVHCKDGSRPAAGERLGKQARLGEGETGFAALLSELLAKGYRGPLTIEREFVDDTTYGHDVREAVDYLRNIIHV